MLKFLSIIESNKSYGKIIEPINKMFFVVIFACKYFDALISNIGKIYIFMKLVAMDLSDFMIYDFSWSSSVCFVFLFFSFVSWRCKFLYFNSFISILLKAIFKYFDIFDEKNKHNFRKCKFNLGFWCWSIRHLPRERQNNTNTHFCDFISLSGELFFFSSNFGIVTTQIII